MVSDFFERIHNDTGSLQYSCTEYCYQTQLPRHLHIEVPDEGHREQEDIEIAYCIEHAREIRRDVFLQAMTWNGRVVYFLQRIAKENRSEEQGDVEHPDTKEA